MDFLDRIRGRAEARRRGSYLGARIGKTLCFAQGDQSIANQAGAAFRSDLNSELQALVTQSSGTSAPGTTYAHQLWADTTNNVIKKRNAANSGWIVIRTLDESFLLSRSSDTVLGLSDFGKTLRVTGSYTQTFTAVATLADGWWIAVRVESGAVLTCDPNASENIDGATTKVITGPASGFIYTNGSALYTVGFVGSQDMLFTDATYDIGKSGATRPRDGFFSRNVAIGGTLAVTGVATFTAAPAVSAGIQFPATQAAQSDANNLDDYEEGTWTPTFVGGSTAGTQTYTTQIGRYTKVGRLVTIEGRVVINTKDGTTAGNMVIGGLPFTTAALASDSGGLGIGLYTAIDLSAGYSQFGLTPFANSTSLIWLQSGDNVGASNLTAAAFANGSGIAFGGSYSV